MLHLDNNISFINKYFLEILAQHICCLFLEHVCTYKLVLVNMRYIYHGFHISDMCMCFSVLFANKRITRTVTMATVVLCHRGHIFYMIAVPDNDTPVKLRGGHRS